MQPSRLAAIYASCLSSATRLQQHVVLMRLRNAFSTAHLRAAPPPSSSPPSGPSLRLGTLCESTSWGSPKCTRPCNVFLGAQYRPAGLEVPNVIGITKWLGPRDLFSRCVVTAGHPRASEVQQLSQRGCTPRARIMLQSAPSRCVGLHAGQCQCLRVVFLSAHERAPTRVVSARLKLQAPSAVVRSLRIARHDTRLP